MTIAAPGVTRAVVSPPSDISEMCSYALDAWVDDAAVLTDEVALLDLLHQAARAGHATVVGQSAATFPNGAVTAVLLLAQSHLSVHTWPEHRLANFDLLTCGRLNGELVIDHLKTALRPNRANVVRIIRDV